MEELKELLISKGANLVGFANLNGLNINSDMPFGVSVVVKLSPEVINSIQNGQNMLYFEEYHRINNLWDGSPVTIEQGGIDRIFNVINLSYSDNKLLFGGKATIRIEGKYYAH